MMEDDGLSISECEASLDQEDDDWSISEYEASLDQIKMDFGILHACLHFGFGCDICTNSIFGPRYRCIICDDYDLCEECYQSNKSIHHHPFYKIDTEGNDATLMENPLNNECFSNDKVKVQKIDCLFQILCKANIYYHHRNRGLNVEDIDENDALKAENGLTELKLLFQEFPINNVETNKIEELIWMLKRRTFDADNISTLIKETEHEFAAILGKISEVIIRKTIKMRKCFMSLEQNKLCKCGHDEKTHNDWKKEKHTQHTPTSVVGTICFKNTAEDINMGTLKSIRNKKYFRVASDTSIEDLSHVTDMNWLECTHRHPRLLISLIGDTEHVKKDDKQIKNLKNGLMNASLLTDAVIVTNGLHSGIAKLVGEAVQEVFYDPNFAHDKGKEGYEPLLVGVTSWRSVLNKENLISENGEASYDITSKKKSSKAMEYLDCFHNRFILVDDADGDNMEETTNFRSSFESLLVKEKKMFVVVIGGDEKTTLRQIIGYWKKDIPTYIVPGTGGLAKTLCDIKEARGQKMHEMLTRIKMENCEDDVNKVLDGEKNLFHELKLDDKQGVIEHIMFNILKEDEENCDLLINIAFGNTIRLQQSFSKILIQGCTGDTFKERWQLIEYALQEKTIQKHMFPNGIDFENFQTELLNAAFEDENVGALPWLQDVVSDKETEYCSLLSELTEGVYPINGDKDTNSESKIDSAENRSKDETNWEQLLIELFLWSLLMNKLDLAKLLCRISRDVLGNCIVGYGMLMNLAEKTDNISLKQSYEINAREFSNIAVEMLNHYQKNELIKAKEILHAQVLTWGRHTYLDIAMKMKNNDFKDMMDKQWMGDLNPKIGVFTCLLCIFCPPLVLCLDLFENDDDNNDEDSIDDKPNIFCHAVSSMTNFYSAPFIVYINNVISYLIFLQLFSYTIITEMNGHFSWVEMLLMVWVFSIFCDEIRQLLTTPWAQPKAFKKKCIDYASDFWNIIDMVSIMLFAAAVLCRYVTSEVSLEVARVLYACSFMTFYLRILHMFSINKKMGPTLHMIAGMLHDFALFVGIILILMISYGVASYSLSYPNSDFTLDLPWKISRSGFWPVFGNFFLEETEVEEPMCSFNVTIYSTQVVPRCPTAVSRYVNPILLGFYFIIANVLLLNFIISVFSNAMADVSQKSKQKWLHDRCFFIYTYLKSPILAPPFILLSHVKEIICQIKRKFIQDRAEFNFKDEQWKIFSKCTWWQDSRANGMLCKRKEEVEDSGQTLIRNLRSTKDDLKNMDKTIKTMRNEVQELIEKQNKEFQKKFDEIVEILNRRYPPCP